MGRRNQKIVIFCPSHLTQCTLQPMSHYESLFFQLHIGIKHPILELLKERLFVQMYFHFEGIIL